jgi:hypothetical protein
MHIIPIMQESHTKAGLGQKSETLSEKYLKQTRTGGMTQMVMHLHSKHNVLSSN